MNHGTHRRHGKIAKLLLLIASLCLLSASTLHGQVRKPALRSITIVTEPAAGVWLDGVRYGSTDEKGRLVIASVLPGARQLRVRANGFAEVSRSLPATTRGDVTVKLTKTTDEAELAFQSAESLTTVDREKAITEYERAVKLRPTYFDSYIGLARAHSERGDIEKAFRAVQSAKKLKPTSAEAIVVEARLLKDGGEEAKALAAFKRAITAGRGFQPEANTGLGLLYKDRAEAAGGTGDYEGEKANYAESAKYLAAAVNQLGSSPDAMVVMQILGLIYERQQQYKEAIACTKIFSAYFPTAAKPARWNPLSFRSKSN